jgi:DNA-binding LacI/PurR family transcriptional regulator
MAAGDLGDGRREAGLLRRRLSLAASGPYGTLNAVPDIADDSTTESRRSASGRIPTMRDVAARLGVSRQLVSQAMSGSRGPSDETRALIIATAEELGYRPNASARLLRQQRTRLLGLVFDMRNPFQVRVAERAFAAAEELGFALVPGPVTADRDADDAVAALLEERVEALLVFNAPADSPGLASASQLVPVVLLGEWTELPGVDNVHVDEIGGLHQAVTHLAALGHRSITYVGGSGARVGRDRADAYRAAMTAAGLESQIDLVDAEFSEEAGASAARALLARPSLPTAIVCDGDQSAVGAMAVFSRAGVRIPEDISVVGFDDSYLAALSYHQLTSVKQDVEETVAAAVECAVTRLDERLREPRRVATTTELVVRSSTATPRRD